MIERYGKQKIPEGCTAQDWGITYDELEPYYDAFEWDIGASGQAGNIQGRKIPGRQSVRIAAQPRLSQPSARGDAAWRELRVRMRTAWAPSVHPAVGDHVTGLDRPVWESPRRLPVLRLLHEVRMRGRREGKSPQHAPSGRPRLEELRGSRAREGAANRNRAGGLATGVTYVDAHGQEHFQPADVVVVSAFTLENNRLLLLSRSKAHPDGIGNDRGRVGKTTRTRSIRRR